MDRRDFLKISGAAAASAGLAACAPKTSTAASESKQSLGPDHMEQHFPGIGLLGFGCMRWPSSEDGVIDQQAVNEMVDYALAHGVNYYDSAPVYLRGQSERATAIALLRHPRESYMIATKCSNFRGPWSFGQGRDLYLKSFENFETDYIDYYLLHSLSGYASFKMRFEDTGLIDYFVREREAGRIRHLGFSFHGPAEGFDEMMALHDKYHWDFVQIQMNYSDWTHAKRDVNAIHMYEKLTELGIPIVLMEPLLGGRLATQPAAITDMLKAERPDKSVASWAFRFVGSFPQIMCVLSGMTRMEHLKDNLETYLDFEPLSEEEFRLLDEVAVRMNEYPQVECNDCKYCLPCPYGIDIPGVFKFYNDNIKAGTYVVSSEQKHYARVRKKYLLEYNKAVPTVRQADHCIGCKQCLETCPQQLNIPEELRKIDNYIEKLKQEKF
ncbi:MAG: aldo/keto reductase [Bacteroidales bacterium]|nr:aldo/keto reductase [Bacteroidales bacterium]